MFRYLFVGGILEVIVLFTDPERMEYLERTGCGGRSGMITGPLLPTSMKYYMFYFLSTVLIAVPKQKNGFEKNSYIGEKFLGFSLQAWRQIQRSKFTYV